jgi:hypothetical protein
MTTVRYALSTVNRYQVSMLLGLAALVIVGAVEGSLIATISIAALVVLIGTLLLSLEADGDTTWRTLQRMFWAVLGLRILFAAVTHLGLYRLGLTNPLAAQRNLPFEPAFMFVDEFTYWGWAKSCAEAWQSGNILGARLPGASYATWVHILGFIRFLGGRLGGDTIFNARLAHCAASALLVPYTYLLAKHLFDHKVAALAAALTFILPEFWYLGISLLRDVLISLLVVLMVYQTLQVSQVRFAWWRFVLILVIGLVLIPNLRHHFHYLVLGAVVLCIALARPTTRSGRILRRGLFVGALLGTVAILFVAVFTLAASDSQWVATRPIKELLTHSQAFAQRWIGYVDYQIQDRLANASADSLGAVLLRFPWPLRIPLSAVRLFLMPLPPWGPLVNPNTHSWVAILAFASGLLWYALLPLLLIGLWSALYPRWRDTVWIWAPQVVLALALALTGAPDLRYRLMLMPLALTIVAQGWYSRHKAPQLLIRLGPLVPVAVLGAYAVLKYLVPRGVLPALLGAVGATCAIAALGALLGHPACLAALRGPQALCTAGGPPSSQGVQPSVAKDDR